MEDQKKKGGGACFLIHDSISSCVNVVDKFSNDRISYLCIDVKNGNAITCIHLIYNPPMNRNNDFDNFINFLHQHLKINIKKKTL